jgi:hypothetical protein
VRAGPNKSCCGFRTLAVKLCFTASRYERRLGRQPRSHLAAGTSRDVAELEPSSRRSSTYVLQEYFVPVDRFDDFVPQMRNVLRRHGVNVVNVSIRHANKDPGSLQGLSHHYGWPRETELNLNVSSWELRRKVK